MNFTIIANNAAYVDLAETVMYGLRAIGHAAEMQAGGVFSENPIIIGAHTLAPEVAVTLPKNAILYNTEQPPNLSMLANNPVVKDRMVWDYSAQNVATWRSLGVRSIHVPVGYMPELTRVEPAVVKDIDVFFSGWCAGGNRLKIFADMDKAGIQVMKVDGLFHKQRDQVMSRAKLVLNLHFYSNGRIFEIVRVSQALACKKAVLTETSSDDEYYGWLKGGIANVTYEGVVDECKALLSNPGRLRTLEEAGFERFSRLDERVILQKALDEGR